MICIYIIVKRQSKELYFPRRHDIIQNWTFLFNMVCFFKTIKRSSYLTDQLFLYSGNEQDLTYTHSC